MSVSQLLAAHGQLILLHVELTIIKCLLNKLISFCWARIDGICMEQERKPQIDRDMGEDTIQRDAIVTEMFICA